MKLLKITLNPTSGRVAKSFFLVALLLAARSSVVAGENETPKVSRFSAVPVFTEATLSAGFNATGYTFGNPIWGDFDDDGDLDLFAENHFSRPPYLYLNNGDGTFADIFPTTGIDPRRDRHGSAWVDFDNDGDLDLSITKGANPGLGIKQDELYLNLGGGQFTNIAPEAGVINTWGRGRSVAAGDYDNDGQLDLLLGNLRTDLVLYRNMGDGTFTDVTLQAGLGHLQYTEAVFADYNNDGFADIFCTATIAHNPAKDMLLKNNGDVTFTNVSAQA
nr:VCBS repeat-containing protein [Blastocatellia bacterium]MBA3571537.1 VCBS repeat-containing protein [Pyrinomonadaceae bacterium]